MRTSTFTFELNDSSIVDKAALDAIPEVMGSIPQSGDRYQIVVGGGVASVHNTLKSQMIESGEGGEAPAAPAKIMKNLLMTTKAAKALRRYSWQKWHGLIAF